MTAVKIIALINWIFAVVWGLGVLFVIFSPRGQTDAAGQGQLGAMIIIGLIALALLLWLNWLPHTWTKILALIIGTILMMIVYNIIKGG